MRRIAAAVALASAAACVKSVPSAPPPVTADQVTAELVEAGCLAPGSSAPVLAELQLDGGADPALQRAVACLFDGGTVAGCAVPCGPADAGAGR